MQVTILLSTNKQTCNNHHHHHLTCIHHHQCLSTIRVIRHLTMPHPQQLHFTLHHVHIQMNRSICLFNHVSILFPFNLYLHPFFVLDPSYYCPTPYSMPENSPQSFISSTPVHSSNVCLLPSTQVRTNCFHSYLETECLVSISSNINNRMFHDPDWLIISFLGISTKTPSSTSSTYNSNVISNTLSSKLILLFYLCNKCLDFF